MIMIRTMKQVATSRTIPSFRSCPSFTNRHGMIADQGRMMQGFAQVLTSDTHRKWRNLVWKERRL